MNVIGVKKGYAKMQKIFQQIMAKMFLNLMNTINSQIQAVEPLHAQKLQRKQHIMAHNHKVA